MVEDDKCEYSDLTVVYSNYFFWQRNMCISKKN